MNTPQKFTLTLSRLVLGWMFFYAGIVKVLNPHWSAGGYLASAKTFTLFYTWLSSPSILPLVNFMNEWGLTLLGVSLIVGALVRYSAILGALMMILYYFPILQFPHPSATSYIVDEHIIYAAILLFFAAINAGRIWGIDYFLRRN